MDERTDDVTATVLIVAATAVTIPTGVVLGMGEGHVCEWQEIGEKEERVYRPRPRGKARF